MQYFVRIFAAVVSIAILLAYIGPTVTTGEVNLGSIFGYGLSAVVMLYAIFFHKVNAFVSSLLAQKGSRAAVGIACAVLAVGVAYFGTMFGLVAHSSHPDSEQSNVAVVLGCKVYGDQPGVFLARRINVAYDYLTDNPDAVAVLSGGKGSDELISEAECMYNTLVAKGIDPDRLMVEDQSTSTDENFAFTSRLLADRGITGTDITVITNDFHQYRASLYARHYGFVTHSLPSRTPRSGYMTFTTREVFAVTAMLLR